MLYGSSNNGDLDQDFLTALCTAKSKEKCNGHFIRVKVLERLVLKHIQAVMGYILRHEDYFRTIMEEQLRVESCEQIRIRRKRLESNERRIAELKRLFIKIYEDNASRRLTDERYDMLSQTYEAEQKQLEAEVITLQQEIEVQERHRTKTLKSSFRKRTSMSALKNWTAMLCVSWCPPSMWTHRTSPAANGYSTSTSSTTGWALSL